MNHIMLTIFCTSAATDALSTRRGQVVYDAFVPAAADVHADTTPAAWQCHAVTIARKRVLILMQTGSRFALCLWGLPKGDVAAMQAAVQARLLRHQRQYAQSLGVLDEVVLASALQTYAANLDVQLIAGQTSRSVQAHLNDAVALLRQIVAENGLPPDEDAEVFCEDEINRGIRSIKGGDYFYPAEAWHQAWLRDVARVDAGVLAQVSEKWRDLRRQWFGSVTALPDGDVPSAQAMTDLVRLDELMVKAGDSCMNLAMLDGFFTALVSAPNLVLPSQYLDVIWSGERVFESKAHLEETLGLLTRHWNHVLEQLQLCIESQTPFEPFLYEPHADDIHGADWALGYMTGMGLWSTGWEQCFAEDDFEMLLSPVFLLVQAADSESDLDDEAVHYSQQDYQEILHAMMMTVPVIHALFEPYRHGQPLPSAQPVRQAAAKVGRNELCPCGSGKKFKQCCGKAGNTLH